jgi:hypothetical protein
MRTGPPEQLVQTLVRLGLATRRQVAWHTWRARRLARDLPGCDAIWLDALVQGRVLTPWQAAELAAGRSEQLRLGPLVLCERLPAAAGYECFRARRAGSRQMVRGVTPSHNDSDAQRSARLEKLASLGRTIQSPCVAPLTEFGAGERSWAAVDWLPGRSAAAWLARCGRFPPAAVQEIAQAMLAGLAALHEAGIVHGDVSLENLWLGEDGRATLLCPGLAGDKRSESAIAADRDAAERVWAQLLCGRADATPADVPRWAPRARVTQLRAPQASSLQPQASSPKPQTAALAACLGRGRRLRQRWMDAFQDRPRRMAGGRWAANAATAGGIAAAAIAVLLVAWLGTRWFRGPSDTIQVANAARHANSPLPPGVRAATEGGLQQLLPSPASGRGAGGEGGSELPSHSTNEIQPATYQQPAAPRRPADLVLASDRPVELSRLDLRPGQRVRGLPGKRPQVVVPPGGVVLSHDDVCFENLDFVARATAAAGPTPTAAPAMLVVQCQRAEFCGCTFRPVAGSPDPPAALRWSQAAPPAHAPLDLPTGRLTLVDCLFDRVAAAVVGDRAGAMAFDLSNVLHLGPGPLLRLERAPGADEPLRLVLSHLTLRESGPLVDCPTTAEPSGGLAIEADGCVLAPAAGAPLLRFCGPVSPARRLAGLTWTGQGSLLATQTPLAAWQPEQGDLQLLDDSQAAVAGLVRGDATFAGPAHAGPAASRARQWQAPLPADLAPGVDPRRLPGPKPPTP